MHERSPNVALTPGPYQPRKVTQSERTIPCEYNYAYWWGFGVRNKGVLKFIIKLYAQDVYI